MYTYVRVLGGMVHCKSICIGLCYGISCSVMTCLCFVDGYLEGDVEDGVK